MVNRGENLWTKLLRVRYLRNHSFFECEPRVEEYSLVWKGILNVKGWLRMGSCFCIGDGWSINPGVGPWVPDLKDKILVLKEGIVVGPDL